MKIHMIGHASLLIQTIDKTILMDPILGDPHQEELFDITPSREVLLDRFPALDMIVLSHKHLDHFDIRSLVKLPRNIPIITPKDPLLKEYLELLKFERITQLADFSVLRIGQTTLMTTRSENPVPEYGVIFTDPSGVFWNQVDSHLSPKTVRLALKHAGTIDFLLASWQPMLEAHAQRNQHVTFPYKTYEQMLYNLSLVDVKALAPGANGFRYRGESSWLNQVVFPVSREQFLHDVEKIKPDLRDHTFTFDPGDVLEINDHQTTWAAKASPFVKRDDIGREFLDFSPTDLSNSMRSQSLPDFDEGVIATVVGAVSRTLGRPGLFDEHVRWNVIYQLDIVFPDRNESWHCDFTQQSALVSGRHPRANLIVKITAAALTGLALSTRGWDYCLLGGYYRIFNRIFIATPNGILRPPQDAMSDPLAATFPYEALFHAILKREVDRWYFDPVAPEVDVDVAQGVPLAVV